MDFCSSVKPSSWVGRSVANRIFGEQPNPSGRRSGNSRGGLSISLSLILVSPFSPKDTHHTVVGVFKGQAWNQPASVERVNIKVECAWMGWEHNLSYHFLPCLTGCSYSHPLPHARAFWAFWAFCTPRVWFVLLFLFFFSLLVSYKM